MNSARDRSSSVRALNKGSGEPETESWPEARGIRGRVFHVPDGSGTIDHCRAFGPLGGAGVNGDWGAGIFYTIAFDGLPHLGRR